MSSALGAFHDELLASTLRVDVASVARGPGYIRLSAFTAIELCPTSMDDLVMSLLQLPARDRFGLSPTAYLLYAYGAVGAVESDPRSC